MATETLLDRLKVLVNSSTPIVLMETVEERRALVLLKSAAIALNLPLFEWSIADGLTRTGSRPMATVADPRTSAAPENGGPISNTQTPAGVLAHIQTMTLHALFVLKDFHRHMDDPVVIRRLREVAQEFSRDRRTLVITGPSIPVPAELQNQVEYVEMPLPDQPRLRALIDETYQHRANLQPLRHKLLPKDLEAMATALLGLTEEEAERTVAQVIVRHGGLMPLGVDDVLFAKKEILRRADMLEFLEASAKMASVGGLENLKKWLQKRRGAWEPQAKEFGLEPPHGVIIMGVQGCGKSLCARAIAGEWQLPLVRFDTASVYDKFIGETEKRVKKLFCVAEQLAPCVLWIDELEKVFAGSGPDSASVDAGVSARLLGSFLSWLQDREAAVFVAATCNNVGALPPELIRKGRFDEIFFVDLPTAVERRAIFGIQLSRRRLREDQFDLEQLAAASEGYSGAEIDAALQSAMYAAYAEKKPITTDGIVTELRATVPLSTTRAEEIETLRQWARTRAVPASAAATAAQPA